MNHDSISRGQRCRLREASAAPSYALIQDPAELMLDPALVATLAPPLISLVYAWLRYRGWHLASNQRLRSCSPKLDHQCLVELVGLEGHCLDVGDSSEGDVDSTVDAVPSGHYIFQLATVQRQDQLGWFKLWPTTKASPSWSPPILKNNRPRMWPAPNHPPRLLPQKIHVLVSGLRSKNGIAASRISLVSKLAASHEYQNMSDKLPQPCACCKCCSCGSVQTSQSTISQLL
jgi:hypothetical protein